MHLAEFYFIGFGLGSLFQPQRFYDSVKRGESGIGSRRKRRLILNHSWNLWLSHGSSLQISKANFRGTRGIHPKPVLPSKSALLTTIINWIIFPGQEKNGIFPPDLFVQFVRRLSLTPVCDCLVLLVGNQPQLHTPRGCAFWEILAMLLQEHSHNRAKDKELLGFSSLGLHVSDSVLEYGAAWDCFSWFCLCLPELFMLIYMFVNTVQAKGRLLVLCSFYCSF